MTTRRDLRSTTFSSTTASAAGGSAIADDELFEGVIGRLKMLVPRELYLAGDRPYVDEKVDACVEAGIISVRSDNGHRLLVLTGRPPLVRYPDGEIRDYPAGLELARERLDRDNASLRNTKFDVREIIPSIADDPASPDFQALLASMREHGFLKQFPVVRYEDGVVIDGRARCEAARILNIDVEYMKYSNSNKKDLRAAHLRDTPLTRVLVALDGNCGRLSADVTDAVRKSIANVTRRGWDDIEADLVLTAEWRRSIPPEYSPKFEVTKLVYRPGDDPKVQTTPDHKVGLRSLLEAAGLSQYLVKHRNLGDYVPIESARSVYSTGQKAQFARAQDLITGIAAMKRDRTAAKLKYEPEWDQISEWLVRTFGPAGS